MLIEIAPTEQKGPRCSRPSCQNGSLRVSLCEPCAKFSSPQGNAKKKYSHFILVLPVTLLLDRQYPMSQCALLLTLRHHVHEVDLELDEVIALLLGVVRVVPPIVLKRLKERENGASR